MYRYSKVYHIKNAYSTILYVFKYYKETVSVLQLFELFFIILLKNRFIKYLKTLKCFNGIRVCN